MKQKSFLRRLVISYLVIAILPLSVLLTYYFVSTLKAAERTAEQKVISATELASSQFNSLLTHMSFLSISMMSNDNFMTAVERLNMEEISGLQQQEYYAEISSEICTYAIFSSQYDVTFFNDRGYLVTSHEYNRGYNYTYRMSQEMMEDISWYQKVQKNYGREVVTPIQENQIPRSQNQTLALVRAIRNPGQIVGYLCIEIGIDKLDYLLELDEALEMEMLIARNDGTVLYQSEGFPSCVTDGKLDQEALTNAKQKYLLTQNYDEETGTTVAMAMSKSNVYAAASAGLQLLGLEALCLLSLTILVIIIFTKDLSKPLKALREEMEATTIDNLEGRGSDRLFNRYEELAYLYDQFNEMRERLNIMIQREMATQKMYLEERMNYLQAQINPHFMCNTLNVIGIMGSENGVPEVYNACLRLSSILQYSIADKAEGNCTIRDEMDNIRAYLELMGLRYEHKLEHSVFYEEEMGAFPIPRLVLEPFVENIFVHAYGPKHKIVRVSVTGYIQKDRWYIVIEDNGQGMEEEKLARMKSHIDECCRQMLLGKRRKREYGIGIENTMIRLCLYYNGAFSYDLENREDTGFRITLSANLKRDENNGTDESADCGG